MTDLRIPQIAIVARPEMYGAVGDGVTDDTAAVQSAIDSGYRVALDDTYKITSTLLVSADRTVFTGRGTLTNAVANGPLLRFLNVQQCEFPSSIFLLGNWASNSVAVELNGALRCKIGVRGDEWPTGVKCVALSGTASQNTSGNVIDIIIANGINGISFQGDGTRFASNNTYSIVWAGAGNTVSTGVNFVAFCDNNICRYAVLNLDFAGSIGVVVNSSAPTSDVQVYENHFDYLVAEAEITGTTSIKGNRTWQTPGMFPARVTLRPSGNHPPTTDVAATCDIQWVNSQDGVGNFFGRPGVSELFVGADTIGAVSGATLGTDWSCPIWTMPESAASSVRFSTLIPSDWRSYKLDLLWAPSTGAGGNVDFAIDLAHLGNGFDVSDGTATSVAGAAGTAANSVVTTTLLASQSVPAGTTLAWGKLSRTPASTIDTATCDVRVIGLHLTRVL